MIVLHVLMGFESSECITSKTLQNPTGSTLRLQADKGLHRTTGVTFQRDHSGFVYVGVGTDKIKILGKSI